MNSRGLDGSEMIMIGHGESDILSGCKGSSVLVKNLPKQVWQVDDNEYEENETNLDTDNDWKMLKETQSRVPTIHGFLRSSSKTGKT